MNTPKNAYLINIEQETLANTDYRRVLFTAKHMQLVLMALPSGEETGEETHHLDQFIRVEEGDGTVIIDGEEFPLPSEHAIIIPAGRKHNIINSGKTALKLYTIYAPPEHKDRIVEKTKKDAFEEHFDGVVSEGAQ